MISKCTNSYKQKHKKHFPLIRGVSTQVLFQLKRTSQPTIEHILSSRYRQFSQCLRVTNPRGLRWAPRTIINTL